MDFMKKTLNQINVQKNTLYDNYHHAGLINIINV